MTCCFRYCSNRRGPDIDPDPSGPSYMFLWRDPFLDQLDIITPSGRKLLPYDPAVFCWIAQASRLIVPVIVVFIVRQLYGQDDPSIWTFRRTVDIHFPVLIDDSCSIGFSLET